MSGRGVTPDPDRLILIQNLPSPRNEKHLQQVLVVCNYYRQFRAQYSNLIYPFRVLLSDKAGWKWEHVHELAFVQLKRSFLNCFTIRQWDRSRPLYVQIEASDKGISWVSYQLDEFRHHQVIALVSSGLLDAEKRYGTMEKELLAIVYSVTKFRVNLSGQYYQILTYHKGLTFLKESVYSNARLERWSLIMQQYTFDI